MAQRGNSDPKVSCPACSAAVSIRSGIVVLGGRFALLCPRCGELTFAEASPPLPRRR